MLSMPVWYKCCNTNGERNTVKQLKSPDSVSAANKAKTQATELEPQLHFTFLCKQMFCFLIAAFQQTHVHPSRLLVRSLLVGGRDSCFQISLLAEVCGWRSLSGVRQRSQGYRS